MTAKFGFRKLRNDVTTPCLWNASNYMIGAASFFITVGKRNKFCYHYKLRNVLFMFPAGCATEGADGERGGCPKSESSSTSER